MFVPPGANQCHTQKQLVDIVKEHCLNQVVDIPTRHDKTLDLLLTNNPVPVSRVKTLPPIGKADHDIVLVEYDIKSKRVRQTPRKIYLYKRADMDGFTIFDGVVGGVIVISAILAYARGLVREIMSIVGWIAAAILAFLFAPLLCLGHNDIGGAFGRLCRSIARTLLFLSFTVSETGSTAPYGQFFCNSSILYQDSLNMSH